MEEAVPTTLEDASDHASAPPRKRIHLSPMLQDRAHSEVSGHANPAAEGPPHTQHGLSNTNGHFYDTSVVPQTSEASPVDEVPAADKGKRRMTDEDAAKEASLRKRAEKRIQRVIAGLRWSSPSESSDASFRPSRRRRKRRRMRRGTQPLSSGPVSRALSPTLSDAPPSQETATGQPTDSDDAAAEDEFFEAFDIACDGSEEEDDESDADSTRADRRSVRRVSDAEEDYDTETDDGDGGSEDLGGDGDDERDGGAVRGSGRGDRARPPVYGRIGGPLSAERVETSDDESGGMDGGTASFDEEGRQSADVTQEEDELRTNSEGGRTGSESESDEALSDELSDGADVDDEGDLESDLAYLLEEADPVPSTRLRRRPNAPGPSGGGDARGEYGMNLDWDREVEAVLEAELDDTEEHGVRKRLAEGRNVAGEDGDGDPKRKRRRTE